MKRITLDTPAKVNFFLEVTGKRPDGYHELSTVFQAIGLYDRLTLEKTGEEGVRIEDVSPEKTVEMPLDESNLAVKAALMLFSAFSLPGGLSIRIAKTIPSGAGLGGGSSDAAAVLYGLNTLYDLGLSAEELTPIAMRLGADVPFFLTGGAALGAGIGEKLEPLPAERAVDLVIVKPAAFVSTKEVFETFDRETGKREIRSVEPVATCFYGADGTFPEAVSGLLHNALAGVTEEKVPAVAKTRRVLLEKGACGALMSGSGSAVYGVFRDRKTAENAFNALLTEKTSETEAVFLTETVPDGIRVVKPE